MSKSEMGNTILLKLIVDITILLIGAESECLQRKSTALFNKFYL